MTIYSGKLIDFGTEATGEEESSVLGELRDLGKITAANENVYSHPGMFKWKSNFILIYYLLGKQLVLRPTE